MSKMLNQKKVLALLLIAAMILASATTAFAATMVTTTTATPLYRYATVADGSYSTVPQGTSLSVVSTSGVFYYVLYGGNYGYILQSACSGSTGGSNISFYVTTNTLTPLYTSASTTGGSYGNIISGQSVGVISTSGSFYYVKYDNYYGYVLTSACTSNGGGGTTGSSATVTYSTPLYVTASTTGGTNGTLDSGDIVTVYSQSGIFSYVYIQGRYGYVLTAALRTGTSGTPTYSQYVTTTLSSPLYSSASTSASSYTTIPSGARIGVISTAGSFYYTLYNGYYGYIPTSYCSSTGSGSTYSFYVTTTLAAPVYSSASTGATSYTTIPVGTSVGVISTSGAFYYVLYNGYYGYIPTNYCSSSTVSTNTSVQYYMTTRYATPLYSTTSTTSTTYTTIAMNTSVGVISATFDGYYYVYVNGNYGYVLKDALYSTTGTTTPISGTTNNIATYGTVAAGSTLYSSDSTTSSALGRVSNSGQVSIISQTTSGFYYVKVGSYVGYLQTTAVTVASDATVIPISDSTTYVPSTIPLINTTPTTGVTTKNTGTVENCVSWVSLRSEADSSSERLAKVTKGSSVSVLGTEGRYTKVSYAGTTGYILSSYIG